MSKVIEKWNHKWKTKQLALLTEDVPKKTINFLKNLDLISIKKFGYRKTLLLFYNEKEKNYYHLSISSFFLHFKKSSHKNEVVSLKDFENLDYFLGVNKEQYFTIKNFISSFHFEKAIPEIMQENVEKTLEKGKQEFHSLSVKDFVFSEEDNTYYIELSNGTKIPYKKEDSHIMQI